MLQKLPTYKPVQPSEIVGIRLLMITRRIMGPNRDKDSSVIRSSPERFPRSLLTWLLSIFLLLMDGKVQLELHSLLTEAVNAPKNLVYYRGKSPNIMIPDSYDPYHKQDGSPRY
jgi:hypothetical protein